MYCSSCGNELNENAMFCNICGTKTLNNNYTRIHTMRCEHCGGTMEITDDRQIMFCPFCQSQNILIESDDVKVANFKMAAANARSNATIIRSENLKERELAKQKNDLKIAKIKAREARERNRAMVKAAKYKSDSYMTPEALQTREAVKMVVVFLVVLVLFGLYSSFH